MNDLTIIIKTLDRYDCLKKLIRSIIKKYKNIPILIGDDSNISCKENIKKDFPHANIKVYEMPHDCGLSYGRNFLITKVKTKYFCLCDDDFVFDKKTDLKKAMDIIKEKKVDILGGYIRNYKIIKSFKDRIIRIAQTILHYELPTNYIGTMKEKNGILYINYRIKDFPSYEEEDIVMNFFIARTEVIKNNPWDNELKLQEHTAFFYSMKKNNVKVAFTNQLSTRHCPVQNKKYRNFRTRNFTQVFMRKNNISKIISTYDNKEGTFETEYEKLNEIMVSIIVPVYNISKRIEPLIRSIKAQTYKNIEVLLVDNNSSDDTKKYLDQFTKNDKRFRVLEEKKQGPNYARKKGFEEANGEYIYFCDADDYLEDDAIYQFVLEITRNNSDVVIGNYIEHNGSNMKKMKGIYQNYDNNLKKHKDIIMIKPALWNKIFKKDLINDQSFIYTFISEDLLITLLSLGRANKITYINNTIYHYIASDTGLSATTTYNKLINLIVSQKLVKERFNNDNLYNKYKDELEYIFITHTIYRMLKITTLKSSNEKIEAYKVFYGHLKELDNKNKYFKKSKAYRLAYFIVKNRLLFNLLSPFIKILFTNKKINRIFRKLDR